MPPNIEKAVFGILVNETLIIIGGPDYQQWGGS